MVKEEITFYRDYTAVGCEKTGHCPHEGTAVGSFYCCRCGKYIYSLAQRVGFYSEYVNWQKSQIYAHPEWGVKYI